MRPPLTSPAPLKLSPAVLAALLVMLLLLATAASARTLWSDGFESASFTGWTANGATLTTATAVSSVQAAALNSADSLTKTFSLANLTRVTVHYARAGSNMADDDHLLVEWYDGKKWNLIEDAAGPAAAWQRRTFRLPANASCNKSFRLRFRTVHNATTDYALLDDVAIEGISLVPVEVAQRNDIENGTALNGRDGGYSFALDGRIALMFGDTVLTRKNSEGITWVVNTMYSTPDLDPDDGPTSGGLTGGFNYRTPDQPANQWIPCTPTEQAFNDSPSSGTVGLWPGAAFFDPLTARHYVFTMKVIEYPGVWPDGVGMGISRVDNLTTAPARLVCRPGEAEDTILFTPADGGYGNMALVEGEYVYAYYGKGESWGDLRVARAPLSAFTDRSRWRFWSGSDWLTSASAAAVITQAAPMGTIHWNAHLGAYLLTYMGALSDEVRMRVADRPEGPWSEPAVAFKATRASNGKEPYGALAHQALQREGGRMEYITYNIPGVNWTGSRVPLLRLRFETDDTPTAPTAARHWTHY